MPRVTREQAIRILVRNHDHWFDSIVDATGNAVDVQSEEDYPLIYDVLEALGVPQMESRRIESVWPPEERDRKPVGPPYTVEVEDEGCQSCGHDRTWVVTGPDGDGVGGTTFGDKDLADDLADLLNDAYATGCRDATGGQPWFNIVERQRDAAESGLAAAHNLLKELARLRRAEQAARGELGLATGDDAAAASLNEAISARASINELLDASSFGTPEAKRIREHTPSTVVDEVMARPWSLLYRVSDELRELKEEVSKHPSDGYDVKRIRREAADVANMAMMVADACDAAERERFSGY